MSADDSAPPAASSALRILRDGGVVAMTALVITALALLPLLTPWVMHAVLDIAGSAGWLGMDTLTTHAASDRTVDELVFGPGTWQLVAPDGAPFYGATEVEHLRDVRQLLWLTFLAAGLSAVGLLVLLVRAPDPDEVLAAIGLGGAMTAVTVVVIGIVGVLAFDPLFELFHRVFFPEGDWAFDPSTQRLVQLYPFAFWQVMAALLGLLMITLGIAGRVAARVALERRRRAW